MQARGLVVSLPVPRYPEMEVTYQYLIKPIPPRLNLSNIEHQPFLRPCPTCKALLPDRRLAKNNLIKTDYELIDTYPEFPLLKKSAKIGCELCWFLRKTIRAAWAIRPMEEWGVGPLSEKEEMWNELLGTPWDRKVKLHNAQYTMIPIKDINPRDTFTRTVQLGGILTSLAMEFGPASAAKDVDGKELHGDISQILGFKVYDSVDLYSNWVPRRRRIPAVSTLCERNVTMAIRWICGCILYHKGCQFPGSANPWTPRRLIHIRLERTHLVLRLVEIENPAGLPYMALSHMWGDVTTSPPLRTLKFNYEAMKTNIRTTDLPQNFLDAVRACNKLGCKWLWIDSLCIIQDDPEDWARESGTMHLVYKYAIATLVATSATSSHDGFLERNTSAIPAVKVGYVPGFERDRDDSVILARQDDVETGVRRGDVDSSKWNSRGWTMQERSLSTRLIYFCANNLYFECRDHLYSESNEPEEQKTFYPFQLWPRSEPSTFTPEMLFQHWRKAVIEYSHRQLTRASDKLPAIQSIANEMASHVPGTYISFAGLWEADIQRQLVWYVERGNRVRLPEYRAPTWSWASLDVWIGFVKGSVGSQAAEFRNQNTFELLGFGDEHADEPLLRNYVEMKGLSRSIARITAVDDGDCWSSATRGSFPFDLLIESTNSDDPLIFAHGMLDLDNRDDLTSTTLRLLYFHVLDDQHPSGLILELAPQELQGHTKHDVWTRVGVATIFHGDESSVVRQELAEATVIIV